MPVGAIIFGRVDISERPVIVAAKERIGDWEADTIVDKGRRGATSSVIFPAFRSASCVCLRIPFEKVIPPHPDVALLGHVVDESPVMERDRRLRVGHGIIFQGARQTMRHCPAPFGGGASSDEQFRNLRTIREFLQLRSTTPRADTYPKQNDSPFESVIRSCRNISHVEDGGNYIPAEWQSFCLRGTQSAPSF